VENQDNQNKAPTVNRCILCDTEFVGQQYMAIAPMRKGKKLEVNRISLIVRFHQFMGEPADICWDCSKECIKEAYDGSRQRKRKPE